MRGRLRRRCRGRAPVPEAKDKVNRTELMNQRTARLRRQTLQTPPSIPGERARLDY